MELHARKELRANMFYRIHGNCFAVHKYFRKFLVPPVLSLVIFDEYMFQQDGTSAHTSKTAKKWLQDYDIIIICFRVAIVKSRLESYQAIPGYYEKTTQR